MKFVVMLFLAVVSGVALAGAPAKPNAQQKYQVLFLAHFVDGYCLATIDQPVFTADRKSQCAYVRTGLTNKCFERGTCPKYEDWSHATRQGSLETPLPKAGK